MPKPISHHRIKELIAEELQLDMASLADDTLLEDIDLDSLSIVMLLSDFQDEFGVDLSIHDLQGQGESTAIATVGELIEKIESFASSNDSGGQQS